jgi:hypothetical protein
MFGSSLGTSEHHPTGPRMPCDVDMIETGDVDYLHWSLILICQSWKISSSEVVPQLLKHCLGLGVRSILYWPTWMTFARMVIHPKCVYHLSAKDVNGCISKPNTSIYILYTYIYIIHIYIDKIYYTYIYIYKIYYTYIYIIYICHHHFPI